MEDRCGWLNAIPITIRLLVHVKMVLFVYLTFQMIALSICVLSKCEFKSVSSRIDVIVE